MIKVNCCTLFIILDKTSNESFTLKFHSKTNILLIQTSLRLKANFFKLIKIKFYI